MPSDSTRNTLARQWELLKLLPSRRPGKTVSELTAELADFGFTVTKRTVERDLSNLSGVFPLDCNTKGTPYGWFWAEGSTSDLPGITLADALSLQMVEDTVEPLLPASVLAAVKPRFQQAANKLAAQKKNRRIARWADKVRNIPPTLPLTPPQIDTEVLQTVQSALLDEQQIDVDYQPMEADEPKARTLHPLALVQRGPVTYLVATAFEYSDIRLFALHRMSRAERLPKRAKVSQDFDLDAYIYSGNLQFGDGHFFQLKAHLTPSLARILEETPLSDDQKIKAEGSDYILTATVADSWQLRWWILAQGDGIWVNKPAKLKKELIQTLQEALAQYDEA